jgi:hypothetical protein
MTVTNKENYANDLINGGMTTKRKQNIVTMYVYVLFMY